MTRTPPAPALLILVCANCKADMIRAIARGLWIGDGAATVQDGFSQVCAQCGHVHQPGDTLRYRFGGVA